MRKLILIAASLLTVFVTHAQDFSYTVSTDSIEWNELNAQTILNANNSAWDFSYKIPIGFSFGFCGRNFDSLTIETNGYIVFDNDRNYALTAFSGVGDALDSLGNHSVLGYQLTGSDGGRILKIQFLNCHPPGALEEYQSWQVWLFENGNVEMRVGPGTLRYNGPDIDQSQKYRFGFLNMNQDTEDVGFFLNGNPHALQGDMIDNAEAEPVYIDSVPPRGFRFVFIPAN